MIDPQFYLSVTLISKEMRFSMLHSRVSNY